MNAHQELADAKTIAIVGCSQNPYRASNQAVEDLLAAGYTVVPVNPKYRDVNGIPCYADLAHVPDSISIDIVNVFRNSEHTAEIVETVIHRSQRTGRKPLIWTQLGVSSPEAELAASDAGIPYVKNRCIMVELANLKRGGQDEPRSF